MSPKMCDLSDYTQSGGEIEQNMKLDRQITMGFI